MSRSDEQSRSCLYRLTFILYEKTIPSQYMASNTFVGVEFLGNGFINNSHAASQ